MQYPCEAIAPRFADADKATFPSIAEIKAIEGRPVRPLKVCIATEDIVGPIRNGGIGTTYTHLSFLLADAGHDVTIFYPRGRHSETNTIDYWVGWYRERGVRFVPLDLPNDFETPAARWLRPMLALYDALKAEHFDMVHVSEWRGLAYLSLLAKKQGLHFQNTLFCTKSSSPYLWNREFMLEPISDTGQLVKIFAERRSIELADMVIGGSRHLLVWMLKHGYLLPNDRTYVHPNVAVFAEIDPALMRDRPKPGTRVPVKEIVFFGRLEGRKGLDVFCDAIHKLKLEGVKLPKITFLGKAGARIATYPEMSIPEYIESQASSWDVEWQIIDDYRQAEALSYLLAEGRLAVMPSVIENSSLTVYEATHFHIPFVASNCGGNPELVAEEHCDAVLTPTHPVPLSEKIREALEKGGFVAAPSFDNNENLEIWRSFHANIHSVLDETYGADGRKREKNDLAINQPTRALIEQLRPAAAEKQAKISVCLVLRDDHSAIRTTLESVARQSAATAETILVNDGSEDPATLEWLDAQRQRFQDHGWRIFDRSHYGTPVARNFGASHAASDYVLFLDPGTKLETKAMESLASAAGHSGADVLVPFHQETPETRNAKPKRVISIKGDPCFPFFNPDMTVPLILVKRQAFDKLGGFTTDYKMAGDVAEFLAAATMAGMAVETIPEVLAFQSSDVKATECLDQLGAHIRALRPYASAAPLCFQPLLLASGVLEKRNRELSEGRMSARHPLSPIRILLSLILLLRPGGAFVRHRMTEARGAARRRKRVL
jgi:glycosyltransferase involved in cell wall biosynthesis/GT2 family glycosyltransferase